MGMDASGMAASFLQDGMRCAMPHVSRAMATATSPPKTKVMSGDKTAASATSSQSEVGLRPSDGVVGPLEGPRDPKQPESAPDDGPSDRGNTG